MTRHETHLTDDGVAIFLFHGVLRSAARAVRNYTRKHLPIGDFEEIIDGLLAHGVPISMPEVAAAMTGRRPLPPRAFAVTFDDGFENNFSVAAPLLDRRSVPATFYVTTGFIDERSSSWIDRIEAAVEAVASVVVDLPALLLRGSAVSPAEKRALLDRVRVAVKARADLDPYAVAAEVESQLGAPAEPDPELDAKMTWDQLRALDALPLFTIGGHGRTHRILEFLPQEALEDEIAYSLRRLREELGAPIRHYSYPEGLAHCYSKRVIHELRSRGVVCAPTAEPGVNRPGDDPFHLKRIMVS